MCLEAWKRFLLLGVAVQEITGCNCGAILFPLFCIKQQKRTKRLGMRLQISFMMDFLNSYKLLRFHLSHLRKTGNKICVLIRTRKINSKSVAPVLLLDNILFLMSKILIFNWSFVASVSPCMRVFGAVYKYQYATCQ